MMMIIIMMIIATYTYDDDCHHHHHRIVHEWWRLSSWWSSHRTGTMTIVIMIIIASYTDDDDSHHNDCHHDDDCIVHKWSWSSSWPHRTLGMVFALAIYDTIFFGNILLMGAAAGAHKGSMGLGCYTSRIIKETINMLLIWMKIYFMLRTVIVAPTLFHLLLPTSKCHCWLQWTFYCCKKRYPQSLVSVDYVRRSSS